MVIKGLVVISHLGSVHSVMTNRNRIQTGGHCTLRPENFRNGMALSERLKRPLLIDIATGTPRKLSPITEQRLHSLVCSHGSFVPLDIVQSKTRPKFLCCEPWHKDHIHMVCWLHHNYAILLIEILKAPVDDSPLALNYPFKLFDSRVASWNKRWKSQLGLLNEDWTKWL